MKTKKKLYLIAAVTAIVLQANAQLKVVTSGNVGINQTSPSEKLDVNGNILIESTNKLYLKTANTYLGFPTPGAGVAGDFLLTSKTGNFLRIGSTGGIGFWGNASGESTTTGFNAFIDGFGLGIGTNAQAWSGVNLYMAGNGWITGTWTTGSDKRFKKNISSIDGALAKLLKLNGKSYEYNKDEFKDYNFGDGKSLGFIAQELKEVLPELVTQDQKGYYGINYNGIIPVIVEAMKEQNKKITDLEAQLSYCCTNKQQTNTSSTANNVAINDGPRLLQNNPNPFSQQTNIGYYLPKETKSASVMIFDMQGKLVKTIAVTTFENASLTINANELSAGMFMYSLVADGKEVDSKRMILTQ